ncbi:MAG: NAD(P)/FAD-dependent oxidoreductase [Chitinophagaceae bacterium]
MDILDLAVVGGGAAGFFCAVNAARMNPGMKIAIIEKSSKLLSKVKVSGGGRCNVTHDESDIAELVKYYPRGQHFLKKAFHHFSPKDTVTWFGERGVDLKVEADGRMFPTTNSSQTIIDCLMKEANDYKVSIFMNAGIVHLERQNGLWLLRENGERTWIARNVCITCGGFNKFEQYSWLTQLGLKVETPVPSLFTFNMPGNAITSLMGVSVPGATIKITGTKLAASGPLLITHWGLSGPAVLKLSALAARLLSEKDYHFTILVNWLSGETEDTLRSAWAAIRNKAGHSLVANKNPFGLPSRLWDYFLQQAGIGSDVYWSELKSTSQNKLIQLLTAQSFAIHGKTTFKEEFVTCGGIALSQIDVNTMQCKRLPGLYFAGEVLDVDGVTGGFNFQNAWTTGWIAAKAVGNGTPN